MSLCARVDEFIELSNGPVTRYTKPAAPEASAAHKCCIKCKAIIGTSAASIYFYTYNIALDDIAWPCSALHNMALRYMTSNGTELQAGHVRYRVVEGTRCSVRCAQTCEVRFVRVS